MNRLPERGDVRVAFDLMDERACAAIGERKQHIHDAGTMTYNPETARFSGGAIDLFRLVYGDLFDFEELLAEGGASLLRHAVATMRQDGEDEMSVLISLLTQSVAVGVLMERARAER